MPHSSQTEAKSFLKTLEGFHVSFRGSGGGGRGKKGAKGNDGAENVFTLKSHPAKFKNRVGKKIKGAAVVKTFMEGLSSFASDRTNLEACLLPLRNVATECEQDIITFHQQESLIRVLLGVEALQTQLIVWLLEKIPEYSDEVEEQSNNNDSNGRPFKGDKAISGSGGSIPSLIVMQLRWMDSVNDGPELARKLIELITMCSFPVQREIICNLPEIISDGEHSLVVTALSEVVAENSQLLVPVLDALGNLNLGSNVVEKFREETLSNLSHVDPSQLPVVLRFVFQCTTAENAYAVIETIRSSLDISSLCWAGNKNASRNGNMAQQQPDEILTMEAIKFGVTYNRVVGENILRYIEKLEKADEHKPLDLILLFVLHSVGLHKKATETLLKKKIKGNMISAKVLSTTLSLKSTASLRAYFPDLLEICGEMVQSSEPLIREFAEDVYFLSFGLFDDYFRQEAVGSLVTHIGSGNSDEIESSLDVLLKLVKAKTKEVRPFAIFIKCILDYIENLSYSQIRKVFSIFSLLSFLSDSNNSSGNGLQDEMHLVIRKQLTNSSTKFRKIGVLGAIAIITHLAKDPDSEKRCLTDSFRVLAETAAEEEKKNVSFLSDANLVEVINLLKLVQTCCQSAEMKAMFYDELSSLCDNFTIDERVLDWINENIASDFQDIFLCDNDDLDELVKADPSLSQLQILPFSNLDGEDSSIAVSIMPLIMSKVSSQSLNYFCPHFKLLQACEKRLNNDDLESIDALLGCPILICNTEFIKAKEYDNDLKYKICCSLFHATNWYIEVINAFCLQTSADMNAKIILRLQVLRRCEAMLRELIYDLDSYKFAAPFSKTDEDAVKKLMTSDKKGGKELGPLFCEMRPYLRSLDLESMCILRYKSLCIKHTMDATVQSEAPAAETLSLEPPELLFLLREFVEQVKSVLCRKVASPFGKKDNKSKGVGQAQRNLDTIDTVAFCVGLAPALLEHMEAVFEFFKAKDGQLDNEDMVVEDMTSEEESNMQNCLLLMVDFFAMVLSWKGFKQIENRDSSKKLLLKIASKRDPTLESPSMHRICICAFEYFCKFADLLKTTSSFIAFVKLLKSICSVATTYGSSDGALEMKEKLSLLIKTFLHRECVEPFEVDEEGSANSIPKKLSGTDLQTLIGFQVQLTASKGDALDEFCSTLLPQFLANSSKTGIYGSCSKIYFLAYSKAVFGEVVSYLRNLKTSSSSFFEDLRLAVNAFAQAVQLVKQQDGKSILLAVLKKSRIFIETFLKMAMPFLDDSFKIYREESLLLLKTLQQSTRSLQVICGHSKVIKDGTLTAQVPSLRKALESIIYRVKAMLEHNECLEAFWLGNLKHRNLKGEEVPSQMPSDPSQKDDETEDESDEDEEDGEDEDEEQGSEAIIEKKKSKKRKEAVKAEKSVKSKPNSTKSKKARLSTDHSSSNDPKAITASDLSEEEEEDDDEAGDDTSTNGAASSDIKGKTPVDLSFAKDSTENSSEEIFSDEPGE
eukprot:Nk52_evm59s2118 gene=Nk52_evmTU59s2118